MQYVVAVAREQNFTRAAERLHVAQQALSQQVQAVEETLGVRLFDRTARPIKLTAAGAVFVQEAKRALAASERVVERTAAAARGEVGKIRLAYSFSVAYETLPVLLADFAHDTPNVKVAVREMFATDMLRYLLEDNLDVALAPRLDVPDELAHEAVRREQLMVAMSEHHEMAAARAIDLATLSSETFLAWEAESPGFYATLIATCRAAGFDPRVDHDASTGSNAWNKIAAGRGVGVVVASAAPQVPRGIALVRLRTPETHMILDAIWRPESEQPAVQRFIDTARRVSSQRGWLS